MAAVVSVGSSFLVAGSAGATVKTAKSTKPVVTVCKSVAGKFRFKVDGKAFTMSGRCAAVRGNLGMNHVTETWAPASYRDISAITVTPGKARVGVSVKAATAAVKLTRHRTAATVSFRNTKVVTTVSNPGGPAQVGTGLIEICNWGSDSYVQGSLSYTVFSGATTVGIFSIGVGTCSGAIPVPAGTATVTEAAAAPYYVSSVTADPTIALGDVGLGAIDVGGATAQFTVGANEETTANFTTDTALNWIKVCKVLKNNQGSLAGSTFWYDISWTFTPPTGATAITETGTVGVAAVPAPGVVCELPTGNYPWNSGIPVGSTVTVNEVPFADTAVTGVQIVPSGADAGSTATQAVLTVQPVPAGAASGAGYFADAVFTNDPLGMIEVCKNFDPSAYDANNSAQFSVNGGTPFTVQGGECSYPMPVPAGTASVAETTLGDNFYLTHVSTVSATDPMGLRLLSSDTANPATVTVPYGDVWNETVVTFTDTVDPTQFKICKQETSADANLSGGTFYFGWTITDSVSEDTVDSGTVALTIAPVTANNPQGEVCSGLIDGPAPVNADGSEDYVTITEETTDVPGVQVTGIEYQGASLNYSIPTDLPLDVSADTGSPVSMYFYPAPGMNVVTYTNGRTAAGDVG
jgi:hypothetical protein